MNARRFGLATQKTKTIVRLQRRFTSCIYEQICGSGSGHGSPSQLSNACFPIAAIYQLLAANLAINIRTRAPNINT